MENSEQLKTSFDKYLNNELSEEEARHFLEHMRSGRDKDAFLFLIEGGLDASASEQLLGRPQLQALLNQSFTKVIDALDAEQEKKVIRRLWPRIVAVAAMVASVFIGVYFFNNHKTTITNTHQLAQDIGPATVGATLTLADGKEIRLSDVANGEIANETGISVTKTADGQLVYKIKGESGTSGKINTLTTAKGETYTLVLPDQSRVYMNAASSLTYAASLNKQGIRRVKLEGEAYFQVAKDKNHPFIVETRGQDIEVLGTQFNVNAYADEPVVNTTLLEGSVRVVADRTTNKTAVLKPGQQAVLKGKELEVKDADIEVAMAWKKGLFVFKDNDLAMVMRQLSRWYNLDVEFKGPVPQEVFNGKVYRNMTLMEVLDVLSFTKVKFKFNGHKMIIFQ